MHYLHKSKSTHSPSLQQSIAKELDESVPKVADIDFVYPDHGLVVLEENPVYQFATADACTRFFVPDFSNSNQLCTDNGLVTYNDDEDVYQHHSKKECCEVSTVRVTIYKISRFDVISLLMTPLERFIFGGGKLEWTNFSCL